MGFTVYCGHIEVADSNFYEIDFYKVSSTNFTIFKYGLFNMVKTKFADSNLYEIDFYKDINNIDDYFENLIKLPVNKRPFASLLLSSDIEGKFHHASHSLELSYNFKDYADVAGRTLSSECMKQYIEWWKVFSFSTHNKLDIYYE